MTSPLAIALAEQVHTLIQDAPSDRQITQGVLTIAPLLAQVAQTRVRLPFYYVLQTDAGELLKTTLIHRTQSAVEKTVILVFSSLEDASEEKDRQSESHFSPVRMPVLDLLFQFWTLNWCDALVFFDEPGNRSQGQEINHRQLSQWLKSKIAPKPTRSGGQGFRKTC